MGRLLLACKKGWEKAEQERLIKQTKQREEEATTLCRTLQNWSWDSFPKSEAEAEALLEKIAALTTKIDLAGLREVWRDAFEKYQAEQEKERQEAEAAAAKQVIYDQKLAEFRSAWQSYLAARERIWATNRERFPVLQERWNTPFAYYELHYALYVRGNEEDEGGYIETASADCLTSMKGDPSTSSREAYNFHAEIKRNGSVQRYEYMRSHVFKVSEEKRVLPLDYPNAGKIAILAETGTIQHLRYPPGTDPTQVEADVRATFEPLPKEPDKTGLNYDDVCRIKRGEDDCEPDF